MKRKKLIVLLLISIAMLAKNISFGQSFSYATLPGSFNISSLESLTSLNPYQTTPPPYYTLFIEPGNGKYFKINDPYIYGTSASKSYSYKIPPNSRAVLNIVGHYDTIKPPRGSYTIPNYSNSATQEEIQQRLASGKSIGFDFSDSSTVIGDTMTLVVTHKPNPGSNSIIALFYNDGKKVYDVIADPNIEYPFINSQTASIQNTRAIRFDNGAVNNVYTTAEAFPRQIQTALSSAMTGFDNALYFMIPSGLSTNERNIFISMAIPYNLNLISATASLKAVRLTYTGTKIDSMEPVSTVLPIGQFASDPNGIRTTPHCLNATDPFEKEINYDITFINDGPGVAVDIDITAWIPAGIELPASGSLKIESTISRKKTYFEKKSLNNRLPNTYEIVNIGEERKIVFHMPGIALPGTFKNKRDVMMRHGLISFKLKTIKAAQNTQSQDKLECMYSDVSIVFTSFVGGVKRPGRPITDSDLVRRDCFPIVPNPHHPCPRVPRARLPVGQ